MQRRLARIYGEALLNAAETQEAAADVVSQLQELVADVTRRDPYVLAFFTSGVIGKERREAGHQDRIRRAAAIRWCSISSWSSTIMIG